VSTRRQLGIGNGRGEAQAQHKPSMAGRRMHAKAIPHPSRLGLNCPKAHLFPATTGILLPLSETKGCLHSAVGGSGSPYAPTACPWLWVKTNKGAKEPDQQTHRQRLLIQQLLAVSFFMRILLSYNAQRRGMPAWLLHSACLLEVVAGLLGVLQSPAVHLLAAARTRELPSEYADPHSPQIPPTGCSLHALPFVTHTHRASVDKPEIAVVL